jgi:hypothetical protein
MSAQTKECLQSRCTTPGLCITYGCLMAISAKPEHTTTSDMDATDAVLRDKADRLKKVERGE